MVHTRLGTMPAPGTLQLPHPCGSENKNGGSRHTFSNDNRHECMQGSLLPRPLYTRSPQAKGGQRWDEDIIDMKKQSQRVKVTCQSLSDAAMLGQFVSLMNAAKFSQRQGLLWESVERAKVTEGSQGPSRGTPQL